MSKNANRTSRGGGLSPSLDMESIIRIIFSIIAPGLSDWNIKMRAGSDDDSKIIVSGDDKMVLLIHPSNFRQKSTLIAFAISSAFAIVEEIATSGLGWRSMEHQIKPEAEGAIKFMTRIMTATDEPLLRGMVREFMNFIMRQKGLNLTDPILTRRPVDDEWGDDGRVDEVRLTYAMLVSIMLIMSQYDDPGPEIVRRLAVVISEWRRRVGSDYAKIAFNPNMSDLARHANKAFTRVSDLAKKIAEDAHMGSPRTLARNIDIVMDYTQNKFEELVDDRDDNRKQSQSGGDEREQEGQGGGGSDRDGDRPKGRKSVPERVSEFIRKMGDIDAIYLDEKSKEEIERSLSGRRREGEEDDIPISPGGAFSHRESELNFIADDPIGSKVFDFRKHKELSKYMRHVASMIKSHMETNMGGDHIMVPINLDLGGRHVYDPRWVIPFYGVVKGVTDKGLRLIVAIDHSSSMNQPLNDNSGVNRSQVANMIAQAIQNYMDENGFHPVIPVVFSSVATCYIGPNAHKHLYHGTSWDSICEQNAKIDGGTSFDFIEELVRTFPNHHIIMLTDGESSGPELTKLERDRVSVIQIGGHEGGWEGDMGEWAGRVAKANTLNDIAGSMVYSVPRPTVSYKLG